MNIVKSVTVASILIATAFMYGCTTNGSMQQFDASSSPKENTSDPALPDGWDSSPAYLEKVSSTPLFEIKRDTLPSALLHKKMNVDLKGDITLTDLADALTQIGIRTYAIGDETKKITIHLEKFKGELWEVFDIIRNTTSIAPYYRSGVLYLAESNTYAISSFPNKEYQNAMKGTLESLGAKDVILATDIGAVFFNADSKTLEIVNLYLDALKKNAAVVNLQVAAINVTLNDEVARGANWEELSLLLSKNTTDDYKKDIASYSINKGVGNVALAGKNLSIKAVVNALSKYGVSKVSQNTLLSTLTGKEISLESITSTPYTDATNSTTTSTTSTTNTVDSSSTSIAFLDIGFVSKVTPTYTSDDRSVMLDISLNLSSLVAMREFDGGEIIVPETTKQNLLATTKVDAGETVLVGGLIYDTESTNSSTLFNSDSIRGGNKKHTKRALFLLVRPTVIAFKRI
ncbi:hypothetical protein V6259_12560 [Marinomonas sp. TI.3.20]|uniref:hypothetical protein n=1 Tax=Marinomonas sp. TI.3.20 TaxID=3121296 RepID=UPI00311ED3CC